MLELIAVALTIVGFFLIEEGEKIGFYVAATGNIFWVIWAQQIETGIYFYVLQVFLFLIAIKGILKK